MFAARDDFASAPAAAAAIVVVVVAKFGAKLFHLCVFEWRAKLTKVKRLLAGQTICWPPSASFEATELGKMSTTSARRKQPGGIARIHTATVREIGCSRGHSLRVARIPTTSNGSPNKQVSCSSFLEATFRNQLSLRLKLPLTISEQNPRFLW